MTKEIYVRGDTLDQVKFKVVDFVYRSYLYLGDSQAAQQTARELCVSVKTVERVLEGKGGEYEEVITKIPKVKSDKAKK